MYLGVDLGTSAVKVCALGAENRIVATASAPLTLSHPFDGASEQDCAAWWAATCKAVQALDPDIRKEIRAIGLSGQMHGAVLLDRNHRPVRPVILWNDARAAGECTDLIAQDPEIGQVSGVLPMAGFTAPKLLWLSRHEPDSHARIAHVLLPKDYLGFRMHGRFVTDPSDAAGTSWFDERTGQWSDRLCAISATEIGWLPELRHGTEIAGELLPEPATDLGLPAGIPVATGAGDAAAGAVGIGAVSADDGFISLGTSGQIFVTTPEYRPNPQSRIHAYAHTVPDHWFQMAAMLNGARPMAWLAELLQRPIEPLLAEAERAEPGPLFLPYLSGERTPHGDSQIRGGFAGLSESATQGSLMRAVVEAIAFSFTDAFDALAEAGTRPDAVLAIGGGTRSDFLMQMIADSTGCRIGRSDDADVGPALGAARLACAALHDGPQTDVMPRPEIRRWFVPQTSVADRIQPRLAAYRAMYPALRSVQSALG